MKEKFSFLSRVAILAAFVFLMASTLYSQTNEPKSDVKTGIATLYARDPLAQSLCLADGAYGSVFQESEARNRCSDINFNGYNTDGFTVAVEGGRRGIIIDIGTPADLESKYSYSETVGKGQGFASIRRENGKFYIVRDRRARTSQELTEAASFMQTPETSGSSTTVKLGHVYLMRLVDRFDKDFALFAKLIVIANIPNESVTFRWQIM